METHTLVPTSQTSLFYGLRTGQLSEYYYYSLTILARQADISGSNRLSMGFFFLLLIAGIEYLEIHHHKDQQKILLTGLRGSSPRMEHLPTITW